MHRPGRRPRGPVPAAQRPPVVPTFDIIASYADTSPGPDGNYSEESACRTRCGRGSRRPAGPACTSSWTCNPDAPISSTQAQTYRDLLTLPYVGLGLDPEWRIGPSQVPGDQIGAVDAAEVNTVITWLADTHHDGGPAAETAGDPPVRPRHPSRREHPGRQPPAQVAVLLQMDGQGTPRRERPGLASSHHRRAPRRAVRLDEPRSGHPDAHPRPDHEQTTHPLDDHPPVTNTAVPRTRREPAPPTSQPRRASLSVPAALTRSGDTPGRQGRAPPGAIRMVGWPVRRSRWRSRTSLREMPGRLWRRRSFGRCYPPGVGVAGGAAPVDHCGPACRAGLRRGPGLAHRPAGVIPGEVSGTRPRRERALGRYIRCR